MELLPDSCAEPASGRWRTARLAHDGATATVEPPRRRRRGLLSRLLRGDFASSADHAVLGAPPPYARAVVAGTFDRLHAGHRLLLTAAALAVAPAGGTLYVGVAGGALTARKAHAALLQPLAQRTADTVGFLAAVAPRLRVVAGELTRPDRGIEGQPAVQAIVCSREVLPAAAALNRWKALGRALAALLPPLRARLEAALSGLAPYSFVVVDEVPSDEGDGKLSSTALRARDALDAASA